MLSHQELSGQQVASYLLDHEDHFTSHEFQGLYWTSFKSYVEKQDPSPECKHGKEGSSVTGTRTVQEEPSDTPVEMNSLNVEHRNRDRYIDTDDDMSDDEVDEADETVNVGVTSEQDSVPVDSDDEEVVVTVNEQGELIA